MSNLICIPYKLTSEASFWAPLSDIFPEFSQEQRIVFENDLRELESLRNSCSLIFEGLTKPSTESLSVLINYFHKISYLANRLPKNQIVFSWKTAFKTDESQVSCSDFNFELSNILFNIGAMLSKLGNEENRNTGEGIVNSCKFFQEAAGVFERLKDNIYKTCVYPLETLSVDLEFNFLEFVCALLLAQAQECCWQKAVVNKMSPKAISQLAGHVSLLYQKSYESACHHSVTEIIPQSVKGQLVAKRSHFSAASLFRKAQEFSGSENLGLKIAYLQKAQKETEEIFRLVDSLDNTFVLKDAEGMLQAIQDQLNRASMLNNWVYFHSIPKHVDSPPTHSMVVAKFPANLSNPEESKPPTCFAYLIPYKLYLAPILYESRKILLVENSFIKPLQGIIEKYHLASSRPLIDMSIPMDAMPQIPQPLCDKLAKINQAGGWEELTKTLSALQAKKDEAKEALLSNLESASSILDQVKALEHRSAEAEALRPKIQLFRARFSQASSTDEVTVSGVHSKLDDFQLIFSTRDDLLQFISSQLNTSLSNGSSQDSDSLEALMNEYKSLVLDVASKVDSIKLMSRGDKLDLNMPQYSNIIPELDDDALENVIEDELKKYIRFKGYVEEKTRSHSLLEASIKVRSTMAIVELYY
ncbi:pH-response regulator protein palA/rim20, variant 2 [Entomophthora muscae]|uniref:PH-response regulator protein palA/rim20, variant 2 n=1 Tax=Entomophthora muscae TaxID=34485 RepID=A0ACC2TYB2_9FUNG|nr:pH-response regulator protein palA/rim20, variant 2 [Entomophthora muscae]